MQPPHVGTPEGVHSWVVRPLCLVAAFGALAFIPGCPAGDVGNVVIGKVTLEGKAVSGTITFHGADNKEVTSAINQPDGSYVIPNPPKGKNTITIKGLLGGGVVVAGAGDKDKLTKEKFEAPKVSLTGGVAPPAKYENPATSLLTFDVKGGKETNDIALTK